MRQFSRATFKVWQNLHQHKAANMIVTTKQTYRRDRTFPRSWDSDTIRFEKPDFLQLHDVTIAKHHHEKLSLFKDLQNKNAWPQPQTYRIDGTVSQSTETNFSPLWFYGGYRTASEAKEQSITSEKSHESRAR
jgi:hypothetical protein